MITDSLVRALADDEALGEVLYQLITMYPPNADVLVVEDADGRLSIVAGVEAPTDPNGLCLVVSRKRIQDLADNYGYPSATLEFAHWRRQLAGLVRRQGPV
ncbi:hypothetical protein AB0M43_24015 [Longispora sp. NPDC051575]|uniref:hypothetical protein n=1 Tax=Longispora sp. NPDC051575 TaxID=3154943 RepID=UPI00343C28FF